MEIRLAKISNSDSTKSTQIEFLDPISENQFQVLNNYLYQIEHLNNIQRLLDFVIINEGEIFNFLKKSIEELRDNYTKWNSIRKEDLNKIYLNTNRLLLNYLTSIKTFIDHSSHFISQTMGKESLRFLEFEKMRHYFYDNSFAYRFFYDLRNYAQHVGLPLENIEAITKYENNRTIIKFELDISFKKQNLLSKYKKWNKIVNNDLENISQPIQLMPLILEMNHNLREIKRNIQVLYSTELCIAADFVVEFTKHLKTPDCEIFIAYDIKNNDQGELIKFQNISIPFETIDFIQKELIKL